MIFHIAKGGDWGEAKRIGEYRPESLRTEGFVHCSTADQIVAMANRLFRGQPELVLLCIDEHRLAAPVHFEPAPDAENTLFPHIYGPVNLESVINIIDFPSRADCSFVLPEELKLI